MWSLPEDLEDFCDVGDGVLAQLIDAYQADMMCRLQEVRNALEHADIAALQSQVHCIKGSSKQMAAGAVASACEQIEAAARERRTWLLTDLVRQLEIQAAEVLAAMAEYQRLNHCEESAVSE